MARIRKLFVGRKDDLAFLERCYAAPRAQLVILYGRRRLGKTECLRRFCEGKDHVWYSCAQKRDETQLASFSHRLLDRDPTLRRVLDGFASWEDALADIPRLEMEGRKLVVMDEFPYAVRGNAAIPSIIQNVWDETLSRENVMLVLCGSSVSFMEDELLAEKNPLYGRATGVWKMGPLPYCDAAKFFPTYTPQQKLEAYGILGGVPQYLEEFDPALSVGENVREAILTRGSALYSEVDFLLRQELREPAAYNDILCAVAGGATSLNDIAQAAMIEGAKASTYLNRLRGLHVIERELSVQEGKGPRTKAGRGVWKVADDFVRFWYAAAWTHLSELDAGDAEGVWEGFVRPHLNDIVSPAFEDVCRQWVMRRNIAGELPFRFSKMGRWWSGAQEIDVVALGEGGRHLLGECKFSRNRVAPSVLHELRAKEAAGFGAGEGWLWLFGKEGFAERLELEASADDHVRLVRPEELEE